METSNTAGLLCLSLSVVFGMALGLLYSFCTVLRLVFGGRAVISAVVDAIYWAAATAAAFCFLFTVNSGVVRGYLLIGMAVGAWLYYYAFGKFVVKAAEKAIRKARRAFRSAAAAAEKPYKKLVGIFRPAFRLKNQKSDFNKNLKKHFKRAEIRCKIKENSVTVRKNSKRGKKAGIQCALKPDSRKRKRVE